MSGITKRIWILAAVAALLLASWVLFRPHPVSTDTAGESGSSPENSRAPFRFVVASDLHYLSPSLNDNGTFFQTMMEEADGKTTEYAEEVTEAFVSEVITLRPDALVLTGDLTFNGAGKSHEGLAAKLQKVKDAGIPVYVLSGNHDLNSTNAARFTGDTYELVPGVTPQEFESIYAPFGFSDALSKDSASSSYVVSPEPGLRFLLLDVNGVEQKCRIPEETLSWIEAQLQDAKKAGDLVLSFSHQNLLQHSLFTDGYVIGNADALLALYDTYRVPINFTGHLHIQHQAAEGNFHEAATSALSISPEHYAVVMVDDTGLSYKTRSVDVAAWSAKQGSTNEDLLSFADWSRSTFLRSSSRSAGIQLDQAGIENEKKREEMIRYFAEQNYGYFSGAPQKSQSGNAILKEWEDTGTFTAEYLDDIAPARSDQNVLTLSLPQGDS